MHQMVPLYIRRPLGRLRVRGQLSIKDALEWLNKRCTAQSTLCVGNKKGKTAKSHQKKLVKRAGVISAFSKC